MILENLSIETKKKKKKKHKGNSLVVQWLGLLCFPGPGMITVKELRSCKLHGTAKKKKENQIETYRRQKHPQIIRRSIRLNI